MASLITMYWRDIPAQVIAKRGRRSAKALLGQRFQDAIDRAAMRAGKGSSDAYMADWRREYRDCPDDDLDGSAREAAAALEAAFDDALLERLIRARGVLADAQQPTAAGS